MKENDNNKGGEIKADELIENLRFDCMHYLGERPCRPHVESGYRCTCVKFRAVERRGVIKLGAAGDVLRTTPLLRAPTRWAAERKYFESLIRQS